MKEKGNALYYIICGIALIVALGVAAFAFNDDEVKPDNNDNGLRINQ